MLMKKVRTRPVKPMPETTTISAQAVSSSMPLKSGARRESLAKRASSTAEAKKTKKAARGKCPPARGVVFR
jgi:hypothetical protein